MRPGQIRVFDGLRITTEHVNHFQGALHSGLQDIREILGLGKVFRGFGVTAASDDTITVEPGLAFDFHRNRISCDEPKTLKVTFGPQEEAKYLCVKYEQIEDGQVEGQATLIWDSCSFVLRPDLPEDKENLVSLAKVTRTAEGKLKTEILMRPQPSAGAASGQPGKEPEAPQEAQPTAEGEAPQAAQPTAGGEATPTAAGPRPDGATIPAAGAAPAIPAATSEPQPLPSPVGEATGQPHSSTLQVRQGVTRQAAEGTGDYLRTTVAPALRKKLAGADNVELRFTLAEAEIGADFPASSLSCQTMIKARYAVVPETGATSTVNPPNGGQSTAHGEVTIVDRKLSQFGMSNIRLEPPGETYQSWWTTELTEEGVAHLPLAAPAAGEDAAIAGNPFRNLQLLLRIDLADGGHLKALCILWWKGGVSEEIIKQLETQKLDFTWQTLIAWKASGLTG